MHQPLPWLFPNFRACGASSPLLTYPLAIARRRHYHRRYHPASFCPRSSISPLPPPFPIPLNPPVPVAPFRFSFYLPTRPNPRAGRREATRGDATRRDGTPTLIRYRTPTSEIRTSSSGPQAQSRRVSFIRETQSGERGRDKPLCWIQACSLRLLAYTSASAETRALLLLSRCAALF